MQSCCPPIASASAAALDEIATRSASIAAPRLHPLQLLLAARVRFQLLLSIASVSTAPRLHPLRLLLLASCSGRFQPCLLFSNILCRVRGSVNRSTKVARHYSLIPPHEHPTSVTHRHTQTDTTHTHTHTHTHTNG